MPSLDGTSIVSLISWVWTDISTTLAMGLTNCSPDFRVMGRTLPKTSTMPTCPALTVVRMDVTASTASSAMMPSSPAATPPPEVLSTNDPPHRERDDEEHAEEEETHRSTSCD